MMDPHRRAAHADRVDGNVLSGALGRLFGGEPTDLTVVCGSCGTAGRIAEARVEIDDTAAIVQCRSCTHTMVTIMFTEEPPRLVVSSLAELRGS